jgi:hypothetical protein
MIRSVTVTILLGLAVCACGVPDTAVSPQLNSGITSSNGGGQRQTGALNTQSIGPAGAMPTSSSSKGAAY